MDHLANPPPCLHCNQMMTFARSVPGGGLRRAQSYFLCQRCGHVETRERDSQQPKNGKDSAVIWPPALPIVVASTPYDRAMSACISTASGPEDDSGYRRR